MLLGRVAVLICGSDSTHRPRCAHTRSENTPRKVAQLRAASRIAACKAVSSALRNRDRSLSVRGAGPRVFVPSSRRCRAISRPASALPIFASVHCLPIGETPRAPFLRQRAASGISEVTHTSAAEMCSAIQSSAASALSPTRTITHVRGAERPDRSRAVKDDQNIEAQARRHAVDLLPHRACITIDVDISQFLTQWLSTSATPAASTIVSASDLP